jgi:beta-1,2-mannobiose phosphorylase / 1,2-beta-oligomannan phosphorylase
MDKMTRINRNPLLIPEDVIPSAPGFRVEGIFNCGAIRYGEEIFLLCRVAESVESRHPGEVKIPVLSQQSNYQQVEVETFSIEDPLYDYEDSRKVRHKETGRIAKLTSLSHLRLARSRDGVSFTVDEKPWIHPSGQLEEWGIEDPRIVCLDGEYQIIYSSVCRHGVTVSLITSSDFQSYTRKGVILPPTNKDAVFFPEKISGRYWMLHRPVPSEIGNLNIWTAESDNLTDWGNHRLLYEAGRAGEWEQNRVGIGTPPLLTDKGWLLFYHGADQQNCYTAGLLLLDRDNPSQILAATQEPVLSPVLDYETQGFFPNVVFPCGSIIIEGGIRVYYGAADDKVCAADMSWKNLWEILNV